MTDREKFEAWFADFHGQTIEWVKSQREDEKRYLVGAYVQGYWGAWQAALASQQPADDGWIEWAGGKRPVISGKQVEVKFRGGEGCTALSGELDWRDTESDGDVIAYRVVKP